MKQDMHRSGPACIKEQDKSYGISGSAGGYSGRMAGGFPCKDRNRLDRNEIMDIIILSKGNLE
jgi:hypothetical protein